MQRIGWLCLACVAYAIPAAAQRFSTGSLSVGDHEVTIVFGPPAPKPTLTGAPYSADQIQDYTPKPGDGGRSATSDVIGHFYRDSQGRVRTEQAIKPAPVWLVEVFDPVAGFAYLLDEQKKIAHRMALPAAPPDRPAPRMPGTVESLGTRTIEGVNAVGTRITGVLTIETWVSEELHETLVTKSSNGYSTRLVNLSLADPDAAFFRPPADYTVVDETGKFTLKLRFQ